MGALGWVSVPLYWLCFICLSYRWNTHYLLYTLLFKYDPTPAIERMSAHQSHIAHISQSSHTTQPTD